MTRPATICAHTGRIHTGQCQCAQHQAARKADDQRRLNKRRTHGRNTTTWQKLRTHKLALNPACQLRLPGCTTTATTVHLTPKLRGNHTNATLNDLTSACHHCHGVIDAPRATRMRRC